MIKQKRIKTLALIALIMVIYETGLSQLAEITYTARTVEVKSYTSRGGNSCGEVGDEDYTAWVYVRDNTSPVEANSGCQTCGNAGGCTYAIDIPLDTLSTLAYSLISRIDAWEHDVGTRCAFDAGDDCHEVTANQSYNLREISGPTDDFIFTNGPYWRIGNSHQRRYSRMLLQYNRSRQSGSRCQMQRCYAKSEFDGHCFYHPSGYQ